ncbi:MAG: glutamate 5-kinase [Candidatus Omnitrophota bacterium]
MKLSEKNYKRIVIKIGSSLFYSSNGLLDLGIFGKIIFGITGLVREGKEIVVVSSGAIALGMSAMNLKSRPKDLPSLQAAAAIGQNLLMDTYGNYFKKVKITCAQVLLTWEDFNDRSRYLNAKNTLLALLRNNAIPIVNENDTVSTDEIRFGDNDRLSALVSSLISADLLIILSDVDGLLDRDKKVIRLVDEITPQIKTLACPTYKKTCVGGMITKLEAAKIAVDSGIPCVIANGKHKNIILSTIKNPASTGTLFVPKPGLAARDRWIAFGTKPKGKITVDQGAKKALLNNKSLLSVGILAASGVFDSGDIVSIIDSENHEFARGKVGISERQLDKVKGGRHDKEIIHRNNIVVL